VDKDSKYDFELVDKLVSAYGWSIEYIQELDAYEVNNLIEAINEREKSQYRLLSYIVALAFAGKTIDSVLGKEPIAQDSKTQQENQEKNFTQLFSQFGMPVNKIKEGLKKGKLEI